MTFEAAPAAGYAPHTITTFSTPSDASALLPEPAASKMIAIKQRAHDLHSAIPEFADVRELAETKVRHQQRIQRLLMARAEGGFGQSEDAASVVDERRKLERVEKELQRVQTLREVRSQRWTTARQLEARVSDWLMRGGVPGNCTLEAVEDAPISELLKKGESVADALSRYRNRLGELGADEHRVKSAPHLSKDAKAAARVMIERLAEAAAPDCNRAIEFGLPITFQTTVSTVLVDGTDKPATVSTVAVDFLGLLCWVMRDQVISRIEKELDEIADDKNALDEKTRAEMEATIMADKLEIHRRICTLIWHAEMQRGEIIDFAGDTPPEAVIGVRCVVAPPASPSPGTSPEHVITFGGARW
jgi:hypothetical protein